MTQTEQIVKHLNRRGSITPLEALEKFGCFRLAARILELRESGLSIETVEEVRDGKRYARYVLRQKELAI